MPDDNITTDYAEGWRAAIAAFRAVLVAEARERQAFAEANVRFGGAMSYGIGAHALATFPAPEPTRPAEPLAVAWGGYSEDRPWSQQWQHSPRGEATGTEGRGA